MRVNRQQKEKENVRVSVKRLKVIVSKGRDKREKELRKKNGNVNDISWLSEHGGRNTGTKCSNTDPSLLGKK